MKKVLAMILAVLMFASFAATAFAADASDLKAEKDAIGKAIVADAAAIKAGVKAINEEAEKLKVNNDAAIKQWKADMLDVAKAQKAVIVDYAVLNGLYFLDDAYLDFIYGTEIPMIKAVKGYENWLFDVDSANSLAKTIAATEKELNDILAAGQLGVALDQAALTTMYNEYNEAATAAFDQAATAWANAWVS